MCSITIHSFGTNLYRKVSWFLVELIRFKIILTFLSNKKWEPLNDPQSRVLRWLSIKINSKQRGLFQTRSNRTFNNIRVFDTYMCSLWKWIFYCPWSIDRHIWPQTDLRVLEAFCSTLVDLPLWKNWKKLKNENTHTCKFKLWRLTREIFRS